MVVSAIIPHADAFLNECVGLVDELSEMRKALMPYSKMTKRVRVAQFIADSAKQLKEHAIRNFEQEYPTISAIFESGSIPDACMHRFNDAMYSTSVVIQQLGKSAFVIKLDADREELQKELSTAIGGFIYVLYTVFMLFETPEKETLAVKKFCDEQGITADVLLGTLMHLFESNGAEYYIYEPQHPMYAAVNAYDPGFLGQMEEEGFTISMEQAEGLVTGQLSSAELMNQLTKHMESREEVQADSMSIIKSMRLQ